jgi:hypothetical protein
MGDSCHLGCPADRVTARLPFNALGLIANANNVDINALGFTVRLKDADLQFLRKFIDVVGKGVRIR